MPDWFATLAGWILLVVGALGLRRGVTLLRHGKAARDSTGTPGWLVLVESGGLSLLGAAVLLGGRWVHLIWPAVVLMAIGAGRGISGWRQRRRRRPAARG